MAKLNTPPAASRLPWIHLRRLDTESIDISARSTAVR